MSIKLGLQYLMDRTLNIEMRAVCLSPDFELDAHSQNRMILTAETLPDYLTQMTTSKINLSYSAIQLAETTDVPYKVAASIKTDFAVLIVNNYQNLIFTIISSFV